MSGTKIYDWSTGKFKPHPMSQTEEQKEELNQILTKLDHPIHLKKKQILKTNSLDELLQQCRCCGEWLSEDNFYKHKITGLQLDCKECQKLRCFLIQIYGKEYANRWRKMLQQSWR